MISCHKMKSPLERALEISSNNRTELEKVLNHYAANPADSLKLKAAIFLIENMPGHISLVSNIEHYILIDSLNRKNISITELYTISDSIKKYVKTSPPKNTYDVKTLTSEFLINHINKSVDIWQKSPWYNIEAFDKFCEYVLPYAVSTEKRELWIDYYRNKYEHYLIDYLAKTPYDSVSLNLFCDKLNTQLITNGKLILNNKIINKYPPLMLDNIKVGTCDDYGARTIFIMRSLGMPVCTDFSPQWCGYTATHSWNTLIGEDEQIYPFMGFEQTSKQWYIPSGFHCSKVFRKTYSIQKESLAAQNPGGKLPDFFNYPNIIDVTSQYIPTFDVDVTLKQTNKNKQKFAYLCIFKKDWGVAHWGEIKNKKVNFTNMGANVIYLPAYYEENRLAEAADPFFIDSTGIINILTPHPTKKQTMKLERKYPYSANTSMFINRMLNGSFQGSNDPDFNTYDNLHVITQLPKITFNTVDIKSDKKYRYVRYLGGKGSFTNIAEIEFYASKEDLIQQKKLTGKVIGTDLDIKIDNRGYSKDKAFDNNVLTFFNSTFDTPAWVGLDLGKPVAIEQIRYLPRNDDNNIRIGETYELVYWQNGNWCSLGRKIADNEILIYENCPVNALFLLHNHTRGKEERIFTYVNDKQIWW